MAKTVKPLSEAELRDAESRNRIANRLRDKFGLDSAPSELERMVAEIRAARRFRDSLGRGLPDRGKRMKSLLRNIKADAAAGRRSTLIVLSPLAMIDWAAELTNAELRMVKFEIPGSTFAARRKRGRKSTHD